MRENLNHPDTQKVLQAMQRAARKVINEAVLENRSIPILAGEKGVCKIPREEAQQVASAEVLREPAMP